MPPKRRLPAPPVPAARFARFVGIVRRLRRDCPWDRRQTHRSLREGLIEECYEAVEALDRNDAGDLREELGDILLHIALHATIAEERGEFTLADVLDGVSGKLVRRHPHVFGTARARSAGEVKRRWDHLKMEEGRASILDGVPAGLPSLLRALRVQQRAARVGFDWPTREQVWRKVREEAAELHEAVTRLPRRRREEEFGDLLFALVNYGRFLGVDPEAALRETVEKFDARFRFIERALRERGADVRGSTLGEMDALWEEAKRRERRGAGGRKR